VAFPYASTLIIFPCGHFNGVGETDMDETFPIQIHSFSLSAPIAKITTANAIW
jgi:hypothetical protein